MTEPQAASKADAILNLILTNQAVFNQGTLVNESDAQQLARVLAALRQQLIEDLQRQHV